jgi:hypothetical protein
VRGAGKLWLALILNFCREVERLLAQDSESGDKLLDQDAANLITDTGDAQLGGGIHLQRIGPQRTLCDSLPAYTQRWPKNGAPRRRRTTALASSTLVLCCRHALHLLLGLAGKVGHNTEVPLDEH